MEYNDLVEEILKRVIKRLQETGYSTNNSISLEKHSKAITKRVITERDIIDARRENIKEIIIGTKTLLTDLAKELADKQGINIIRC